MYRIKSNFMNIVVILADCLSIIISLMLSNLIRHGSLLYYNNSTSDMLSLIAIFIISYFLIHLIKNFNFGYLEKGTLHDLFDITKMHVAMFASAMIIIYFTRIISEFSRKVFIYFFLIDVVFMLLSHILLRYLVHYFYQQSGALRQLMVIATSQNANEIIKQLNQGKYLSYHIAALAIIDQSIIGEAIQGIPIVADNNTLIAYCKSAAMDEVVVYLNMEQHMALEGVMKELSSMGIVIHVIIDLFFNDITSHRTISHFGACYAITYANRFLSMRQMITKRTLDLIGGLIGVLALIPVTIILAPIIRIESPGPVFFSQNRVGKNGRTFKMYKFRSMYADAENRKAELLKQNEMDGLMFKVKNDPRITKVGKFIRRTSIDELPQFFNILKGDMSLVGTRPPTIDEFEQYQSYHKKRLSTTPGLTGLWQISGRNEVTDFEDVVKLDISYIDNWSLGLDIKILWKTVIVVLNKKGAE